MCICLCHCSSCQQMFSGFVNSRIQRKSLPGLGIAETHVNKNFDIGVVNFGYGLTLTRLIWQRFLLVVQVENALVKFFEQVQNLLQQLEVVKVGSSRRCFTIFLVLLVGVSVDETVENLSNSLNCILKRLNG